MMNARPDLNAHMRLAAKKSYETGERLRVLWKSSCLRYLGRRKAVSRVMDNSSSARAAGG